MQPDRREFLMNGLATGISGLVGAGLAQADALDDKVEKEMRDRLKFLSPPDGVAADREWGLPHRSPRVTPFVEVLCPHPIIQPEMEMTGDRYSPSKSNKEWWQAFSEDFEALAKKLRNECGLDIGGLPVPEAHQRFWEYRPVKFFILVEKEFPWQFHPMYGSKSWAWGYEAKVETTDCAGNVMVERKPITPGPTFLARYGKPILVRRINDLPEVGNGPDNAKIRFALPSTTSHLHNAHTASESDGFPNDWINPRQYWDHHYANFPSGHDPREKLTTLWYHDHRMDYTAANVYAGLDGFYFLFDETKDLNGNVIPDDQQQDVGDETKGWRLPSGKFDVPLMLHDLAFARDGQGVPQMAFNGFNTDGIIGDRYTANRKIQPRFEVEQRKYRFRIYNGGPSRFYELYLRPDPPEKKDIPFVVITGDGNFQPSPLVAHSIYLGVAQRVDVIIDFSTFEVGAHVYLVNRLHQVDGRGPDGRTIPMPHNAADYQKFLETNSIMRFDVIPRKKDDQSMVKVLFRDLPPVDLTEVRRERIFEFDEDGGLWTVNNKIYDPNRIDAAIEEDSAEIWTIRNNGKIWHHPIHSHFTEHIILEVNGVPEFQAGVQVGPVPRRGDFSTSLIRPDLLAAHLPGLLKSLEFRKDFKDELDEVEFVGTPRPPVDTTKATLSDKDAQDATQVVLLKIQHAFYKTVQGYINAAPFMEQRFGITIKVTLFMGGPRRDIVLLLPLSEVKIFMRWKDFRGKYVMHCHNVVHEDHAMMIRWDIIAPDPGSGLPRSTDDVLDPEQRKPHMEPHPGQATAQEEAARKPPRKP